MYKIVIIEVEHILNKRPQNVPIQIYINACFVSLSADASDNSTDTCFYISI